MKIKKAIISNKDSIIIFMALIFVGIVGRLLPHLANFTPLGAIALFGGYYFRKEGKIILPLLALFIGDCFLGFYDLKLMLVVYFCFFLNVIFGSYLGSKKLLGKAAAFSIAGSIIFFIATNFAVWAFGSWYPHTISGLAACFYLALPFARNTFLGDLFFTVSLFGAYQLVANYAYTNHRDWLTFNHYGNNQKI
jgi:hypothetical protein